MSVVIVGGNERMARQYEELCRSYSCSAKIYMKTDRGIQNARSSGPLYKHHVAQNARSGDRSGQKAEYPCSTEPHELYDGTEKYT